MTATSRAYVRDDTAEIDGDLLFGAKSIAAFLGIRKKDGKLNERAIYHMAEKRAEGKANAAPIVNRPGSGLTARKSELNKYFSVDGD